MAKKLSINARNSPYRRLDDRNRRSPHVGMWIFLIILLAGGCFWLFKSTNTAKQITAISDPTLTLDLGGGMKMELVLVSAGTFTMGSSEAEAKQFGAPPLGMYDPGLKSNLKNEKKRADNEGPQHEVIISKGFYIGKFVVTEAQYAPVMGVNWRIAKNPVVNVTWNEAQEFCKKVGLLNNVQVSLPTEAEWEYACRAGTTTPFYFSNEAEMAKPNKFGLYGMSGYVWQWCDDYYTDKNYYEISPKVDPKGAQQSDAIHSNDGDFHGVRGGYWPNMLGGSRSASRYGYAPEVRSNYISFRVVVRSLTKIP